MVRSIFESENPKTCEPKMHLPSLKVAIIGAGRLSWSLIPNLQAAGLEVRQLISRSADKRTRFQKAYQISRVDAQLSELVPEVELVFLAVSDHAIADVAQTLTGILPPESMLVHCSGSIAMDALGTAGGAKGVFYPLQMFTTQAVVDFRQVPLFVEGESSAVQTLLFSLAQSLSDQSYVLSSEDRLRLHLGAVVACNFTNYLYQLSQQLMPQQADLDFRIYEPLVREQIDRVFQLLPEQTQTGPAIRGDAVTLQKHLALLGGEPHAQKLYRELSLLIRPDLDL